MAADRETPFTTDAYVQAYVVQAAPQVAGQVMHVYVGEGDEVKKGAPLFELDTRPFEHKVAFLEAKLVETTQQVKQLHSEHAALKAEHERLTAEADYTREVHRQEKAIFKKSSTTERKYLDALQKHKASLASLEKSASLIRHSQEAIDAKIGAEHALIAEVKAQLNEAKLNLGYCRVYAPCDGTITNLQLREGAYAHVGQAVLTIIDTGNWLIIANFREKGLERMKPGHPALVAFRGMPGRLRRARVLWIGSGVSQGQGVPSGLLPEVKEQTTWIPAEQRFQVRLALEDPADVPLRIGMTGSVSVYIEPDGRLNPITEAVHRVIAWLYYL
ncbi:MAG TPA: HlyD family secretion protein [Gemmataceae bacterium]|nr:HlyD family secretion protein [Gemmataceae bacterium]